MSLTRTIPLWTKETKHQWNIKMCTRHKDVELHLCLCISGQGFWIISLLRGFMIEQSELGLPQSLGFFNLPRHCTSQCRVSTQACSFISKACTFLIVSRQCFECTVWRSIKESLLRETCVCRIGFKGQRN